MQAVSHKAKVNREDRLKMNRHRSFVLWFTGLSGAGKSTLAYEMERVLFRRGIRCFVLDGDELRHGLNGNLGFGREDRRENIRRAGEVAKLFVEAGTVVLASFISPYREDRQRARELFAPDEFMEIHVRCPLEECARRDPKGLYRKAAEGRMPGFTGIDSEYEIPLAPDIVVETNRLSVSQSVRLIVGTAESRGLLAGEERSGFAWD
ncbi:adenylyl-sulfate kinase [Cohnella cholangitidis]|uniref:Adenylyl-sulfate kinase n=1 Tax=Cohnella cholangitidis TaxID=2598458 RepID=A0A7G5C6T5_9BACL|nr:adenylyl-sulfate kinase [Cohnella cholangitidis]QMV44919.1 adenylyl-sulfate kinase [Cohnella cholangitidis]